MSISRVVILLLTASVGVLSMTGKGEENVNNKCVSVPVTAHPGRSASINYTYTTAERSLAKSFCRRDGNVHCANVISTYTSNYTKLGGFSLTDHKEQSIYTVIISRLTQNDTGRYWCAVVQNDLFACLSEIHLRIFNDTINGQTGKSANIDCPYPGSQRGNGTKYFCKGEDPFNCSELVRTTEKENNVVKGRFKIRDNQRKEYFYVHIQNLTAADTGTYWCGSDKAWLHTGKKLFVGESPTQTKKSGPATQWTTIASATTLHDDHLNFAMIGVTVVCLALLTTVVTVLIRCRSKLLGTQVGSSEHGTTVGQNTERNCRDHDYEEIHMRNQEPRSGGALFSSVYAAIGLPADEPNYTSVTFLNSPEVTTDGNAHPDTDKTISSACEYSSVCVTPHVCV